MEQPTDHSGDPSQGPPLILTPAVHSRTSVKSYPQPIQLRIRQSARRPARSLGDQRGFAASPPPSPPLVHRLRRDPQPVCHLGRRHALLEHLRGLQPHHLPTDPSPQGQTATVRVPHPFGIRPPSTNITPTRRRRSTQTPAIQSLYVVDFVAIPRDLAGFNVWTGIERGTARALETVQ